MRYSLLASASLIAIAFTGTASLPAKAAECGCSKAVAAVLAKEKPVVAVKKARPAPRKVAKTMPRPAPKAMPAPACLPCAAAAQGESCEYGESYDYASSLPVDSYPYTHHWEVAPQGYVPPPAAPMAAMTPRYEGPANLPPYDGAAGASSYGDAYGYADTMPAGAGTAYMGGVDGFAGFAPPDGSSYGQAYAYADAMPAGAGTAYMGGVDGFAGFAPGPAQVASAAPANSGPYITIDTRGLYGGAGRAVSGVGFGGGDGGGGGGGGGSGETLTLSRPDSYNGPSYNSFGESYGGNYYAANQLGQMRQRALQAINAPPSSGPNTGTVSH